MTLPKHKKQRMKIEKRILAAILAMCFGVPGMLMLFGECDSLLLTVLTKSAGIAILYVAAKLWNVVQPEDAEIE